MATQVAAAAQLRFAADAGIAGAQPAQLKPLRGVRCQDAAWRVRSRSCAERNGFGLGEAHPVDVTLSSQSALGVVDVLRTAVLSSSGAEEKPLRC